MNHFLLIPLLIIIYAAIMIHRNPASWLSYINLVPTTIFLAYARYYGMTNQAWMGAFELAAAISIGVIFILVREGVSLDRLMLGLNCFFILGGAAFLFNFEQILQWYTVSKGGPLFGSVVVVGFVTTLFTKSGFIGIFHKNKEAIKYASFLLLASAFIALVWSVKSEDDGLFWSVILPFIVLRVIRQQLIEHVL